MDLGIGLGFDLVNTGNALDADYDLTLSAPVTNSDVINSDFVAANGGHSFIIDFIVPDGTEDPAGLQTLFYYGLNNHNSNYFWVHRNTSGEIVVQIRQAGNGQINLPWDKETIYPSKLMRIGFTIYDSGEFHLYMNGGWLASATGKNIPNYSASTTRLYVNTAAPYLTNIAGDFVQRIRYYNKALTAAQVRFLTRVDLSTLGLSYSEVAKFALVGTGQSLMQGSEETANKTAMPQSAAGNLFNLNPTGAVEAFQESWYALRGGSAPIVPFSAPEDGDTTPNAGYMGRVGNDVAALSGEKVIVANAARSSTKISNLWAGARTDLNVGGGTTTAIGALTWAAFERLRQAQAAGSELRIIDDQGQGDANDGLSQAAYETQKQAQLNLWKNEFPNIHFYIVGLTKYMVANTNATLAQWTAINDAREAVANARADCTFIDLSDLEPDDPDGVHLLNAMQEVVGARIAQAIIDRET